MEVSVLVVTWNSASDVAACLDAALAQDGVELEVLVVDNASTDGTREVLAPYAGRVRLLLQDTNLGYAAGNDLAAAGARGRHLLLLNPDAVMDPGCVRALVDHLESTPGCGAAAALLRYPDGRPQAFARRDVTGLWPAYLAFAATGRSVDRRWRGGRGSAARTYAGTDLTAGPVAVDVPAAACVLVPRGLAQPRLFDPGLPLYFNDADLYRRMRARGYTAQVVPRATARHAYGASTARVPGPRLRAETVAGLRRYVATAWPTWRCAVLFVLLALDAAYGMVRGTTRPEARGTLGGLGLPGGAPPWLTVLPPVRERASGVLRRLRDGPRRRAAAVSRRVRRARFCLSARAAARASGARLHLDVARDADLPARVRWEFRPGSTVRLVVAERVLCQRGLTMRLGGDVRLGPGCEVRYDVLVNSTGRLDLQGRNIVCRGVMVHVSTDMTWEWGTVVGEYASVLDSEHTLGGPPVHAFDLPVRSAPTRLGAGCFVGAHATVTAGVRVGRGAVVGAGSTVTRDVPAGVCVAGVPARPISEVPAAAAAVPGRTPPPAQRR